ncbi:MAG: beta-ketoacyl-ACP synthase [Sandaracinaceae bacterium]|nr:beta-ketoacyl-ACP synthase [Sandaracinaceae bacterium]
MITGYGVLSPIGHNADECAASLRAMRGGIHRMPEWDHISDLQTRIGGKVTGIDLVAHFPRRRRRTQGTVGLYSMYATDQAIAQAGLSEAILQSGRTGVAYGSTTGSSHELEAFCGPLFVNKTMRGLDSSSYLKFMTHTCAANLAATYGIRGRVLPVISACTSGSQSIGAAYESIKFGAQDVMLAGGAEEMHYATAVTFDLLMATSIRYNETPERSPRPFDAKRDGLVIGEGAGTVVLEAYEHAKARGAKILAEIVGYGTNCDGLHITAPSEAGMRGAMELALEDGKVRPSDVDYVNLHGTGTEIGDICESNATASLFERPVPASTQKSYTGHTLGACGAMELVYSLTMMRDGFLAANRNLDEVDPRCGKLGYVRETTSARPRLVMTNNFAFGGVNTSILVKQVEE